MPLVVLTPVLDDWAAAAELLRRLDTALAVAREPITVVIVDDGSEETVPAGFGGEAYSVLKLVQVIRLKKNLGHQRALAVGLCHIAEKITCDAVIVMDSDGEDDPADAARLAADFQEKARQVAAPPIIFAERTRRSESLFFRAGYLAYRLLHGLLTGRTIRFGNFSIVPAARLAALTVEPTLWNHYAASVAGSRIPYATLPSSRGRRLAGRSRQSFVKLVIHGLSALSCYNEIIGVRLILFACVLLVLSLLAAIAGIFLRVSTELLLPGWSWLFAGLLVVFLLQVVTLATNFTLQIISARSVQPFLPARDYHWYIAGIETRSRP